MLPAAERRNGSVDAIALRWRIGAMAGLRLQAMFLTVVFAFATGLLLIDIVGARWAYQNLGSIPDGLEDWVPAGAVLVAGLVFAFLGRTLAYVRSSPDLLDRWHQTLRCNRSMPRSRATRSSSTHDRDAPRSLGPTSTSATPTLLRSWRCTSRPAS